MHNVYFINNPFDVTPHSVVKREAFGPCSVRDIVRTFNNGQDEFAAPTLCLVNGEPRMRNTWEDTLPQDADVSFVRLAGEPVTIIIAAVVIAAAVAVAVMVSAQNPSAVGAGDGPGEQKNGDTVYSLSGEKNQNRLNNSIECPYGRNRLWPSYAALPYSGYFGNLQYQYSLFCLGHGEYLIRQMRFEDTPLNNFQDIEFEIVDPGETFDLFPDNVLTSSEVAGIELYGPNEDEFFGPTTGYVTNPQGTLAYRIEVDVVLPAGLYRMEEGEMEDEFVSVGFMYQEINNDNESVGPWKALMFTQRTAIQTVPTNDPTLLSQPGYGKKTKYKEKLLPIFSYEDSTLTPQRFTLGAVVPPGRYKVRAQRLDNKNTDANSANTVRWESMRCFFPSVRNYGDVTLVAIKARASNNLNNNAGGRFNVIATRKLPIWSEANGWSANTITRNPIWALCDVFRASYGGRLPDTFLDLPTLAALAAHYDSKGICFDYIFDQKTTVWEAARAICRVGRAVPMLNGSQITVVRDFVKTTATQVFNAYNIVAGSLTWDIKLRNIEDFTGLEVQYMDAETWQQETVVCLIGDDSMDNLEQVKLPGCTDRTLAFQEGLYMRATKLYCREQITFKTGLEGYLPRYGDLIQVQHDVPKWGSGGFVKSIGVDLRTLALSDPVEFVPNVIHKLILRKKDGSQYGPVTVVAGADKYTVVSTTDINEPFFFDNIHERPLYLFGEESLESKRCLVVGIQPEGDDVVSIRAVNYDDRVFSFGGVPTPDKYAPPARIPEPEHPIVTGLTVMYQPGENKILRVAWQPALGARRYIIEMSTDGVLYTRVATSFIGTALEIRVEKGHHWIRVAGVGQEVGPWAEWNGEAGQAIPLPGNVLGLMKKKDGAGFVTIQWNLLANADSYQVSVFDAINGFLMRTRNTQLLEFTYTLDDGDVDGLSDRIVKFRVRGVNIRGVSLAAAVLQLTIPARPTIIDSITTDEEYPLTDSSIVFTDHS